MAKDNLVKIGGELKSVAADGIVAGAEAIYDYTEGKSQSNINQDLKKAIEDIDVTKQISGKLDKTEAAELYQPKGNYLTEHQDISGKANVADVYTKSETYNKNEVNNLITTPNQEYVSVTATAQTTAVADVLPATGAADTTYRVGNWDGTQYNDSVFSEYAWNGSAYIKLSTKSQIGEVYDISANHADTKYSDLTAALGANGANIPQSLQKGGMSVKFVQSSDNKYVQFRCMAQNFTTDVTQWQGVDGEPIDGSHNLIESGVIDNYLAKKIVADVDTPTYTVGTVSSNGTINSSTTSYGYIAPIELKPYETIYLNKGKDFYLGSNVAVVYLCDSGGTFSSAIIIGNSTTKKLSYTNTSSTSVYIGICGYKIQLVYYIKHNTIAAAEEKVSELDKLIVNGVEIKKSKKTGFIKSADGSYFGSTLSSCYILPNFLFKYIKVNVTGTAGTVAAIAFYSDSNIGADTFISPAIPMANNITTYGSAVPDNCKYIAVTCDKSYEENIKIECYTDMVAVGVKTETNEGNISQINDILNNMTDVSSIGESGTGYIKSADGGILGSVVLSHRFIPNNNYKFVKTNCGGDYNSIAAIAFYNGIPSTETFISESSVAKSTIIDEYSANVPANCKYIGISYSNTYESLSINFVSNVAEVSNAVYEAKKEIKAAKDGYGLSPFAGKPFYYHFAANGFIKDSQNHKVIASESLEDVELAARLGFGFIEANIHKTSDDKYIVIHGSSGTFGPECKSADENVITTSALQNTTINSVTLDWIKTYVRYDSYYTKYQTTIPSLEEFCSACKTNSIGIFAGVEGDKDAFDICVKYLGNDVIVYGSPSYIRDYFTGFVFTWNNNSATTISQLLTNARSIGAPYLCGLGPALLTRLENDNELESLIEQMHNEGFLVGWAEVYAEEAKGREYIRLGMDFSGSGHSVNMFDHNYSITDLDDNNNQPTTTGTIADGVISLASGETVTCGSTDIIGVGKGNLCIRFNGTLSINFGSLGNRASLVSDGSELLNISDYFFQRNTQLVVIAGANTTITHFVYKTSRC